jgi:RimJ/RimL family protein N-acetyltransferase
MTLEWHAVATDEHLEAVRVCRNEGRTGFFDQRLIEPGAQQSWWERAQAAGDRLFVIREPGSDQWAGFCLLAHRADLFPVWPWITLGVFGQYRGRGVGTRIYEEAPEVAGDAVWAAMWRTNIASIRAAQKAGYHRMGETAEGRVVTYRSGQ